MNISDFIDDDDEDKKNQESEGGSSDKDDDQDKDKAGTKESGAGDDDDDTDGKDKTDENQDEDDDREALRAQRREERRMKKIAQRAGRERQDQYIKGLQEQNRDLTKRLETLEGKDKTNEVASLERSLRGAEARREALKARIRKATEEVDGAAVAEATAELTEVQLDIRQLTAWKDQASKEPSHTEKDKDDDAKPNGKDKTDETPTADEVETRRKQVIAHNTTTFVKKHSWFKPNDATDKDSVLLRQIDAEVAKDGYDSATADYWEELEDRAETRLPHRFGTKATTKQNNGKDTTVTTGGGARNGQGRKTDTELSPERISAMKEAGHWEDPKKRAEMKKKYAEYDKQHAEGR